jgi:hypothetical protein
VRSSEASVDSVFRDPFAVEANRHEVEYDDDIAWADRRAQRNLLYGMSRQFSVLKDSRDLGLFTLPTEWPFQDLAAPLSHNHAVELFPVH